MNSGPQENHGIDDLPVADCACCKNWRATLDSIVTWAKDGLTGQDIPETVLERIVEDFDVAVIDHFVYRDEDMVV